MLKKYGMACAPLLVAGTLAGVAGSAAAADLRGFASAGPFGVMLFQPCEGKKVSVRALKVEDATPDGELTAGVDAVRKIMLDSGRPLYVEFRGDVAGLAVYLLSDAAAMMIESIFGDLGVDTHFLLKTPKTFDKARFTGWISVLPTSPSGMAPTRNTTAVMSPPLSESISVASAAAACFSSNCVRPRAYSASGRRR